MLTIFDEIRDNAEGIVNFAYVSAVSFARDVLQKTFEKSEDEVFKQFITRAYNQATNSDLFKHKLKKQIREALFKEVEGDKKDD